MATLASNIVTLADRAKTLNPDGTEADIAELLSQTNEILPDMHWEEGNLPTGHRITLRTGLPSVSWRLLNQGVAGSKSTSAQVDEGIGMLEAWSEVDVDVADLNGNTPEFRMSEASSFLESMSQEMAQTLFYGATATAPEEFNGFATRYSGTSSTVGDNVLSAGGGSNVNGSIWLIGWGPQTVYGIYPKGSTAGIKHEDLGIVTVTDATGIQGARLRAYQDHWQWKCGLVVKDWRYAVRVCNIDIALLIANSGSQADLFDYMIKAMHRVPSLSMVRPVFYTNRAIYQMFDIQTRNDVISGGGLTFENSAGRMVPNFRGIPIRRVDQLLTTESNVGA